MKNKKTIALFGGSGGLGQKLIPFLEKKYNVISISSSDVDVKIWDSVNNFFTKENPDIVINLAGVNYDTMIHKFAGEYHNLQDILDVNVVGAVNILSCALSRMRIKGYGRIILASSILSNHTVQGTSFYSGTKAFIDSLVRTASAENISKGISVNSLRLGYFDGGMCHRLPEKFQEIVKNQIGLKRWGSIQELYNTIDYIIETEYLTGQNLEVSGGIK